MNKFRPLLSALCGAGGLCAAIIALPAVSQAQPSPGPSRQSKTTDKPAVQVAATSVAKEPATATPMPDGDSDEKTPPTDDPEKAETTETIIDSAQSCRFTSQDRIVVFTGTVKVTDPRFQLVCDRLTVFLNKPAPAGQNAAATPAPTPTPTPTPATGKKAKGGEDAATPSGGSGIDHVLAEGHVVILQKKAATKPGEEEKLSIGRGETGTFDNKSGDMILKGWPSLEQNGSSLIATAENTVMTIHRDSSLDTDGPSKTRLINRKGSSTGSAFDLPTGPSSTGRRTNNAAPAATPVPSATPAPQRHR